MYLIWIYGIQAGFMNKILKYICCTQRQKKLKEIAGCYFLLLGMREITPTLQRQFRLYIPFLGIARPQPQFLHSCVCERFYIFPGSVHISSPAETAAPSWEYIIRSQTHECGNWDWGPNIPLLGIFVSNFFGILSLQFIGFTYGFLSHSWEGVDWVSLPFYLSFIKSMLLLCFKILF